LGHRFVGWYTHRTGGTQVTASFIPNGNITVFARWELDIDVASGRHSGVWWQSNRIPLMPFTVSDHFMDNFHLLQSAMHSGMNNWNISAAPVEFYVSSSSGNYVEIRNDVAMTYARRYGRLRPYSTSGTSLTRFGIVINGHAITALAREGVIDFAFAITSTMAHELGHAIGLDDFPQTNDSLMLWGHIHNGFFRPTEYDIESVNMIYD